MERSARLHSLAGPEGTAVFLTAGLSVVRPHAHQNGLSAGPPLYSSLSLSSFCVAAFVFILDSFVHP